MKKSHGTKMIRKHIDTLFENEIHERESIKSTNLPMNKDRGRRKRQKAAVRFIPSFFSLPLPIRSRLEGIQL